MRDKPPGNSPGAWLFFLIALPQGVFFGFTGTAMPWMLRDVAIPVGPIATASAIVNNLPSIFGFLWAPLIDTGHRRAWLIAGAAASAAALLAGMMMPLPSMFGWMVGLLILGGMLNSFCASAAGALMAGTLGEGERGLASGFYQAGYVGGSALGGGAMLWLLQDVSVTAAAVVGALAIFLPSLAALALPEPAIVGPSALPTTLARIADALKEMAQSPRMRQAFVILLSPVGACAFAYLFTAVAVDYRASPGFVTAVSGFGGGLVTMLGSLIGGVICQHMEKRRANLAVGAFSGLIALGMILSPLSPATYGAGTVLYSLAAGMCFTAYVALVLEMVGPDRGTGATRFAILTAAASIPDSYMTWADGKGYERLGTTGLLAVDAAATLLCAAGLYAWIRRDRAPLAIDFTASELR